MPATPATLYDLAVLELQCLEEIHCCLGTRIGYLKYTSDCDMQCDKASAKEGKACLRKYLGNILERGSQPHSSSLSQAFLRGSGRLGLASCQNL